MSAITAKLTMNAPNPIIKQEGLWLQNRRWDMIFITLSVFLVPIPYMFYLLGKEFGLSSDVSRNLVNAIVSILVGGPHMYATFLRTAFDQQFSHRYPMLIRTSVIIPVVVISLAFLNLTLLLAAFFFWALLHVLHQVTYITELYNHRLDQNKGVEAKAFFPTSLSLPSRLIDYAVIMTCMFPITALKISQGKFDVGANNLTAVIPGIFQAEWFFITMSTIFALSLLAFIGKTVVEVRGGFVHWPKTVFIAITVVVAFFMPVLPNLDTAFQGLNTWHSFQYLALTILILRLREQSGILENTSPIVHKVAQSKKGGRNLYLFSASMMIGSFMVGIVIYTFFALVNPGEVGTNQHFDITYYSAILCFLWIHYYYDHFLFTDFEAIDG